MWPDLYHVYADESNFFYEITLTRDDAEAGWQGQKYILCVRVAADLFSCSRS